MSETPATGPDREELRALVAEELELPPEDVTDDADFAEDLGGDSLLAMALVMKLEKRYGVDLDQSAITGSTTLNEIHAMLSAKLPAA